MTVENKQAQALNEAQWVEDEAGRRSKQTWVVWLLWLFLGSVGGHRFYMGKTGSAITMLILSVVGWATTWLLIGFIPLAIVWIWDFIDLFLISGWLRADKEKTRVEVERDLQLRKNLHS